MVGDEKALAQARAVADFDAPKTTCPACLSEFDTEGTERCPECGLRFV